eukprot:TRINITY_DN1845_c0_g1_i1.p1 TRINITY_DN1845_c0_g1~~TRINITY_DN1845_c0_g1_i1.p1  ORF type:complete len:412 (+),score=129.11 TRINITY_DN1845_c0_g1_i1:158-1393(+)
MSTKSTPELRISSEGIDTENFNLLEERKKAKKKAGLLGLRNKVVKQISVNAFGLAADEDVHEDMVDELSVSMMNPTTGVKTGKHKTGLLETAEDCFSGEEAYKWISKQLETEKEDEIIQKGQTIFMNRGIFHSIVKKHISFHNKDDVFYRFKLLEPATDNEDPLNMLAKKHLENFNGNPTELSYVLVDAISSIYEANTSNGTVNFKALESSDEYRRFCFASAALQKVSLDEMNEDERLIFFLNIYNTAYLHAIVRYGFPASNIARKALLLRCYNIGGKNFSIENFQSVLRGHPVNDVAYVKVNPIVHVLMFNGSDTSPLVHPYKTDSFLEDRKAVAKEFLGNHIKYKTETDEVWLPKHFKDNKEDFGSDERDILTFVSAHYPDKSNYLKTYRDTIHIKFGENTYNKVRYTQ